MTNMQWIERLPEEGETVKIEFAEWTNLGTKIGVFLGYSGGRATVDFGRVRRHLDINSVFFVWSS